MIENILFCSSASNMSKVIVVCLNSSNYFTLKISFTTMYFCCCFFLNDEPVNIPAAIILPYCSTKKNLPF